jgi:hypothetical protein
MLRYILCSHPRIYIPPESNFIPRYFGKLPGSPLTHEQAIRIMEGIFSYRVFLKDWQGVKPDPVLFVNKLPDLMPSTLINTLYRDYCRQFGASRWGDKSPIYTVHLDLLSKIFPSAQFIHIIRDGRDVALSMLKTYRGRRFFYMDIYFAAQSWKRRISLARSAGERLGQDRYFELHYEDLVTYPVEVVTQICGYLGENFVPAMVNPQREAGKHYHSKGIHAATGKPLSSISVGRWRREMSLADQRLFLAVASDLLRDLQYEAINVGSMSLTEKLRSRRLHLKYAMIEAGRQVVQASGIFHPTSLITKKTGLHTK